MTVGAVTRDACGAIDLLAGRGLAQRSLDLRRRGCRWRLTVALELGENYDADGNSGNRNLSASHTWMAELFQAAAS